LGALPLSLPLARAIAIPSRVPIRSKSTSNSAKVARMLTNIVPIGSVGSYTVPPIERRTPPAASESPIARASGTDRASRSSLGTTSVSPWRTAARLAAGRAAAVAAGHPVIEVDPVVADPELAQRVTLGGEFLLIR
jgi:hypothetical protein